MSKTGNPQGEGDTHFTGGQVKQAIEHYKQALAKAHETGDRRGEGRALGNLGIAYFELGQVERAIKYFEQALAISREISDRGGE